jgi:hypothetical protein
MQTWSADRWIGIGSLVLAVLLVVSPFRRYVNRFNDWYDHNDRDRIRRRLEFTKHQLQDIRDGTSHLHFQKSISGGLLFLAIGLLLIFLTFVVRRGDQGSAALLVVMAFVAAVWQFGSAYRRLNGIRENELLERVGKLEKRLHEFKN